MIKNLAVKNLVMKKMTYGLAAAGFAALLTTTAANAGIIIDDFTDYLENDLDDDGIGGVIDADEDGFDDNNGEPMGDGEVRDNTNNGVSVFDRSVQVNGTIIGGDRELVLSKTNGPATASLSVGAGVIDPGFFTHSNPATVTGISLLRWDGSGAFDADDKVNDTDLNPLTNGLDMGLGSVDLTQGGLNLAIHIKVISADLDNSSITLTLYTTATDFSTTFLALPKGASDHIILLSTIAAFNTGGTGVDLLDVNAIELQANGGSNFDVAIDIIEVVVPEPESLTLLGAGLVGLGYFGKRRKA